MLSDEQMGYVLQIRETEPPLPESTIRIMLKALRWSPDDINRTIIFLKSPPAPDSRETADNLPATPPKEDNPKESSRVSEINIKQTPFPIGSPFSATPKSQTGNGRKRPALAGAIFGFLVFLVGLIAYGYFSGILSG